MASRRQVLASAAAVALAGCQGSEPRPVERWPQIHFDAANTGYAPGGELPADPATTSTSLPSSPVTSAVTSENRIFFGLDESHVARDQREGTTGWLVRPSAGRRPTGTPAVDDDHVYVTERAYHESVESSLLRALEPESGTESWRVEVDGGFVLAPTLVDETLYVRSERGVHAVDVDGTVRWSRDAEQFDPQGFNVVRNIAPAVGRGVVYAPDTTGVTAYDAETGEEQWHAPVGEVHAAPTLTGETVLIGGVETGVVAVDADDGSERWSWDGNTWTSPAVTDGTAYVTGDGLVALDIDTGDVAWRYDVQSDIFGSPVVVGDSVVVTSISRTHALRREGGLLNSAGEQRWSVATGSMSTPTPVATGLTIPAQEEKLWTVE